MSQAQEIIEAAQSGDVAEVKSLLGADPHLACARSRGCGTPLHYAAKNGHIAVMELLLKEGAAVQARDHGAGATPLHWAANGGQVEAARLLLDRGADLNGTDDRHRQPPIGWATALSEYHEEMAEFLLCRGAKLNVFAAVALGRGDALHEMVKYSLERAFRSEYLIARDRKRAIRRMVSSDPGVLSASMSACNDRRQPLHLGVLKNRPEMVSLLLDLGADLHAKTASGRSALYLAAECNRIDLVNLLLARGAEIDDITAQALGQLDRVTLLEPEGAWDDIESAANPAFSPR